MHRNYNFKDLTGQTFGALKVISFSERKDKKGNCFWNCECSCGVLKEINSKHLRGGSIKSCGCKRHLKGEFNKTYTGIGELSGTKMAVIRASAIQRNIEYTLTPEYMWNLFLSQNKKCGISGLDIDVKYGSTASLDRIDSKKGYVEGNVCWVHKDVNIMKDKYPLEYFINMCKIIAKNQTKVE